MKKQLTAAALTLSLLTASCLGPNNAFNSIHNWNARVTDSDALKEVLFLGMVIIPVYPITLLGDYLIFNTIDYWGGENPISDPGPFPGFGKKDS
jgi:hypothetical protein